MSGTLATAVYGDDLIPGNVEAVFADAQIFADAADKLESVRVWIRFRTLSEEWTGEAAETYRTHLSSIEASLNHAISAFDDAKTALTDYGNTLSWAQAQAAGLIEAYWTETYVAPTPLAPKPNPYTKRGDAPYEPTLWNRLGWGVSRIFRSQEDWIHGNGQFGDWVANGEGTSQEKIRLVGTSMRDQFNNPGQFAQDMVGWDTLKTDPVAWGGSGGLETLTGLGTGGTSVGIAAFRRTLLDAALPDASELRYVTVPAQTVGGRPSWHGLDLAPFTRYSVPAGSTFITADQPRIIYVETAFGRTRVNPDLQRPLPDATYVVDDYAVFETDKYANTNRFIADELALGQGRRSSYTQLAVGQLGGNGYVGGHLGAASFGVGGERINLVPMLRSLNGGVPGETTFFSVESDLRKYLLQNPGQAPSLEVSVISESGAVRPETLRVTTVIDGQRNVDFFENEVS